MPYVLYPAAEPSNGPCRRLAEEETTAMEGIGNSVAVEEIIGTDCYMTPFLDAGRVAFFLESQRTT